VTTQKQARAIANQPLATSNIPRKKPCLIKTPAESWEVSFTINPELGARRPQTCTGAMSNRGGQPMNFHEPQKYTQV